MRTCHIFCNNVSNTSLLEKVEDSDSGSNSDLLKSPFDEDVSVSLPCSTLKDLICNHKKTLNLEENFKRISIDRQELWYESVAIFKNPSFDAEAAPMVKFLGETVCESMVPYCARNCFQPRLIFSKARKTESCPSTQVTTCAQECFTLQGKWFPT